MLRIRQLILSCLLILSIAGLGLGRDWRGIIPLHSTRADVERLLGPQLTPADPDNTKIYNLNSSWAIYFVDEGEIWFNFVDPKAEEPNCMGNLPLGTVLNISIKPSRPLKLADIGLDEKKIKLFNASNLKQLNFKGYLDATNGFAVVLERGDVYKLQYFGQAKDKRLCPTYFRNLKKQFAWIEMNFDYVPDP
jgi:hypothetical protein